MRILAVTSTLAFGGAERTAAEVLDYLSARHDVVLLALHGHVHYPHRFATRDLGLTYDLSPPPWRRLQRIWRKIWGLRAVERRETPDVIVAFTEGPNLLVMLNRMLGSDRPVVLCVQNNPSLKYRGIQARVFGALIRRYYPQAQAIIALSEGVRRELTGAFRVPAEKVSVIHNPVNVREARRLSEEALPPDLARDRPVVINVGRLVEQKNQALLIRAFRRVRDRLDARLWILGQGHLEDTLRRLTAELGLADDVVFLGWRDNPFAFMRAAQVMALSSDFEGMASVLVEAMACGCPVVSTDCRWGPAEVLENGRYGLLVPVGDEAALAAAVLEVLLDAGLRARLAGAARERAQLFDTPSIGRRYEDVITRAGGVGAAAGS